MLDKIEHIGIAVKNLDESEKIYENLFKTKSYKRETVESEKVTTSFFKIGESKIELLSTDDENSAIGKFLSKKGEGMHHIAYASSDIYADLKNLEKEGFNLINKKPKEGADNKLVAFLHPKTTGGVLIELCMDKPEN